MRKAIIAGNWKMNNTISQGVKLVEELKPLVADANCDVVVCPSTLCLEAIVKATEGTNIKVGAQNMHFEERGAFTGETAPAMLEELGDRKSTRLNSSHANISYAGFCLNRTDTLAACHFRNIR